MKKKIIILAIFVGVGTLVGCVNENELKHDFEITHKYESTTCSIELTPILKTVQEDLLVKSHVVSSQKLTADSYYIQWNGISNFADNSSLPVGLLSCGGGCDNKTSIPNRSAMILI